jgi:hypothetical protein
MQLHTYMNVAAVYWIRYATLAVHAVHAAGGSGGLCSQHVRYSACMCMHEMLAITVANLQLLVLLACMLLSLAVRASVAIR